MYETSYKVRTADADKNGLLKFASLMLMLQEAAVEHADIIGIGQKDLSPRGLGWAMLKASIKTFKIPPWGERVKIKTWVSEVGRVSTNREFSVFSSEGEKLYEIRTQWVLFDLSKRRIERLQILNADLGANGIPASDDSLEGKIPSLETRPISVALRATRNDIDLNSHVNNATYVSWAFESVPDEIMENYTPQKIKINFIEEVAPHSEVRSDCYANFDGEKNYTVLSIRNMEKDARECARIGIIWKKN